MRRLHVVVTHCGRQIHGSIPAFTHTQRILYPPDTASQGAPSLCRCFRPRPACLPETALARCSIIFHHAALLHRSCTPFIRCSQTCPFTTPVLMSLPGCCEASTRPHLHTRRSSRFRSSSIGPCGGSILPEGREGGARLRADRRWRRTGFVWGGR